MKVSVETDGVGRTSFWGGSFFGIESKMDRDALIKADIAIEAKLCELASDVAVVGEKEYRYPPSPRTKPIKIRLEIEYED